MEKDCPICLEPMEETNFTVTKCNHTFHTHCLISTFISKNRCPLCREKIVENDCLDRSQIINRSSSSSSSRHANSTSEYFPNTFSNGASSVPNFLMGATSGIFSTRTNSRVTSTQDSYGGSTHTTYRTNSGVNTIRGRTIASTGLTNNELFGLPRYYGSHVDIISHTPLVEEAIPANEYSQWSMTDDGYATVTETQTLDDGHVTTMGVQTRYFR